MKDIREILIEALKSDGNLALQYCGIYRGEFEDGAEWNPVFPCAMVETENMIPLLADPSGQTLRKQYRVSILIGNEYGAWTLAENLYDYLDGNKLTDEDTSYDINMISMNKVGWRGRIEIIKLEVEFY